MNIVSIFKKFPTQESCIEFLEKVRWGKEGVKCPYCNGDNVYKMNDKNRGRHHCNACRKSFSVTVNTMFHDTRIPLQKWFLAISLMMNAKKGISSRQLGRDLEVTKDTAWRMQMKIRESLEQGSELLSGFVEMDETYVGGKPRKDNKKDDDGNPKPPNKRGRGTKKTPVVGMIEREGKVRAKVVKKDELKAKDLEKMIKENIDCENSVLYTDEYRGYMGVKRFIEHRAINHQFEYSNGDISTNWIEGFWALLKRGIMGQYHKVSIKHLGKYVDEFCFRYNARKSDTDTVFDDIINKMVFA